jgi:endoglucanase
MKQTTSVYVRPLAPVLMLALLAGCEVLADSTGPGEGPGAAAQCDGSGRVVVDGQEVPAAPNGFVSVGNELLDASSCQPTRFVGVARPALSFSPGGGRLAVDSQAANDFARIRAWGANTVRIELAQYYWVPTAKSYDPGYPARVERVVRQARQAGLYVILALQASDRGIANYDAVGNTHQPMPDRNHSIPFWRDVATRFKGDGGVLFDLFSEPYPKGGPGGFSNWDMWLNGGQHPADATYDPRPAYAAVGMQELYDVVRGTGAQNVVILSGTEWGYRLDGVPEHRVRGYNLAYGTHPWNHPEWPDANQPDQWEKDWAFLASTDPLIATEFGTRDCREGYATALLDRADALGMGWIAWTWNAPSEGTSTAQNSVADPVCDRSLLIMDWTGTPTRVGAVVKQRLQSY